MKRNIVLDIYKIILSLMVVGIHIRFFYDFNNQIGYILNQGIFRLAVPSFFIINGYFFLKLIT